jgi:hypothetical protein
LALVASCNPNIRPRRKREVQLAALNAAWSRLQPPPGSRYKAFGKAYLRCAEIGRDLGIDSGLFDEWGQQLRFDVDDRDMDVDP